MPSMTFFNERNYANGTIPLILNSKLLSYNLHS